MVCFSIATASTNEWPLTLGVFVFRCTSGYRWPLYRCAPDCEPLLIALNWSWVLNQLQVVDWVFDTWSHVLLKPHIFASRRFIRRSHRKLCLGARIHNRRLRWRIILLFLYFLFTISRRSLLLTAMIRGRNKQLHHIGFLQWTFLRRLRSFNDCRLRYFMACRCSLFYWRYQSLHILVLLLNAKWRHDVWSY